MDISKTESLVPKLRFDEFKLDWQLDRLSALLKVKHGFAFKGEYFGDTGEFIVVTPGNFDPSGGFRLQGNKEKHYQSSEFPKEYILEKGDILTAMTEQAEGLIGSTIEIPESGKFLHNQRLGLFLINKDVEQKFIGFLFQKSKIRNELSKLSAGTKVRHISPSSIESIKVSYPCKLEQQKIADFLSSVDKKINLLKEKHTLLIQYKKGVIQKLFKQEIRFKDENGNAFPDWQEEKLGNHLEEYKEKSKEENQFEVLTSSRTGLMKQSDYYSEGRITERSNKGFNVIPNGYLTYRSRSDDRQFFFNLNELGFTGIISTYYPVFKMKNNQNKFFVELSRFHKNRFGRQAVGTSQVVLSFNEVKSIKFPMPSTEEQSKISAFLNAIDNKLEVVNEQIELTQTFKKGLLQQMFV